MFNQFPTLSLSLNFIISDLGERGKREENNDVKYLEGGPKGYYVIVDTAEGSGKSFKQLSLLHESRVVYFCAIGIFLCDVS